MLLKKSFLIATAFILLSKFTLAGWSIEFSTTQNDTICFGTTLKLHGYTNTGCPFTWSIPPTVTCFPNNYATNVEISFVSPGQYQIAIRAFDCFFGYYFKTFTVLPLPSVSLTSPFDSICNSSDPILLLGESPVGGIYSGVGILGNMFDPAFASYDSSYIYYEYADAFGCSNVDSTIVYITKDCDATQIINTINVYPNPTNGEITFTGISDNSNSEVWISDIRGKEKMYFSLNNQKSAFLDFSSGIYIYRIKNKSGEITLGKITLTK